MATNATKNEDVNYEKSGPALLAAQPSVAKTKSKGKESNPEWNTLRGHLEARLNSLYTWRQSWWTQNWSDLSQFLLPRRSIWLTQSTGGTPTPNNMTRGREINQSILDPTGTFAVRVCSAGLMSGLASPSRPWFKVTTKLKNYQPDADGRIWMDEIENRIYTVLAGSNFYNCFAQECEDLVVFGSACTIIYEDDKDLIRCYSPCIGEFFFSSGASLRVDGLYRRFLMTVSQIVDFFGLKNCPGEVQKLWQAKGSSLQIEKIIAHSIEPNFGIGQSNAGKVPGNFTWREVYWVYGAANDKPLSMRGFIDQPFTASRWATQANDAYGRSPGMDVIPDVMQLQVESMRKAEALEKQVRPPLLADAQLKNQPASTLPGEVTYIQNLSATNGMRSIYQVNPDIRGMMEDIASIQQRIKIGFFNDLFLMLHEGPDKDMTATEVQAKLQEKMMVLGPVVENLLTESLKPKLHRIFSILQRRGMLPPMPDSMKGVPLDIEFTSIMAVAQRAASTGGLERIASMIGNLAAVYPEAKDVMDVDAFLREFNELLANPQKIFRSPEAMQQLREQQQKQQAAATQMAAAQHGAQTANIGAQAAQTLSETQIGGGATALSQLMGSKQ
jgi:hypothetical protein